MPVLSVSPRMRLPFLVLLAAGCAPPASPPAGAPPGDRTVTGTVTAVDLAPMAYDGDARVDVETADGARVHVLLPAREALCPASYDDVFGVAVGDRVEARGAVGEGGAVRPCTSADHFFRRR